MAPQLLQERQLLRRFHALGNYIKVEAAGHGHDGADDFRVVGVMGGIAHEGLVDLQRIHRQAFEISQRRIAGAEVIHGKAHAELFQAAHLGHGVVQVLDDDAFGDLQL